MKKTIITISEEVINAVVRPISMFLNDIAVGTSFTHVLMQKENVYTLDSDNFPVFTYIADKGGIYKFTMYDLRRFKVNEESFLSQLVPDTSKPAVLTLEFKVIDCQPTLVKDTQTKMYPPFCYEYYSEFRAESDSVKELNRTAKLNGEPQTHRISQDTYDLLFASDIVKGSEDKYYRTLTIDTPLITY